MLFRLKTESGIFAFLESCLLAKVETGKFIFHADRRDDATTQPEREKCENDRKYPNRVNKKKRRSGKRPNCRVTAKTESHVCRVTLNFFFAEPRKMRKMRKCAKCKKCENAKMRKPQNPKCQIFSHSLAFSFPSPPGSPFRLTKNLARSTRTCNTCIPSVPQTTLSSSTLTPSTPFTPFPPIYL